MRRVAPATLARRIAPPVLQRASLLSLPAQHTPRIQARTFFSLFKSKPSKAVDAHTSPILSQSDLFHPLSQSPFPALREKADRIKAASLCPVSYELYGERVRPEYECPDCGFPTHASRERWEQGRSEHVEYCGRLREVNEDEHDIRSGRQMREFENMPGVQPYEAAVSFASWDALFFTRNFISIDTDRAVRQVSKVLSYPVTIAGVLHQNGPFTAANGRITREGRRSMAALHSVLHLPPGSSEDTAPVKPQPPTRIFLLGARAESTLPPALWQQLTSLFPRNNFNLYFIGPEVGLPLLEKTSPRRKRDYDFSMDGGYGVPSFTMGVSPQLTLTSIKAGYEQVHNQLGPFDPYTDVFFAFSPGLGFPSQPGMEKLAVDEEGGALDRAEEINSDEAGSTATGAAAAYSPPEAEETPVENTQPLVQAQTTWRRPLQQILATKCPLFFTAFSPLDLQRDVSALFGTQPPTITSGPREFPESVTLPTKPVPRIPGVSNEFDLILSPGANPFESRKWEIAEWDVRVGVRTNWGIWGIRGRRYEVVEGQE